jgi:hypothetical protein
LIKEERDKKEKLNNGRMYKTRKEQRKIEKEKREKLEVEKQKS